MYGYYTQQGFKGYVRGRWMLFATADEYYEYMEDR
jgi:hypothetical protein